MGRSRLVNPVFPRTSQLFKSGIYSFLQPGTPTTSAVLGFGTLRLAPFWVPEPLTLLRIGAEVTAAGDAASTFRIAAYSDLGNGGHYPNLPMYDTKDSGSASTILGNGYIGGASATVQEITINWSFGVGLYWIGGLLEGTGVQPTFRTPPATSGSWTSGWATTIPPSAAATPWAFAHTGIGAGAALPAFTATPAGINSATYARLFAKAA